MHGLLPYQLHYQHGSQAMLLSPRKKKSIHNYKSLIQRKSIYIYKSLIKCKMKKNERWPRFVLLVLRIHQLRQRPVCKDTEQTRRHVKRRRKRAGAHTVTEHWKIHHSASGEGERERLNQVLTKQSSVCVNLKYDRTSLYELSLVHSMMPVLALHRQYRIFVYHNSI